MRDPVLYLLFLLSGAAGLVYEVLWTRQLILLFGSTVLGISSIVTAFLGGLALGGLLFGRRADRMERPLRTYGLFEIGIGLYAGLVPILFDLCLPLFRWLWGAAGSDYEVYSLLRFGVAALLLLPPTVLMGASLPLLSSFLGRDEGRASSRTALLYGLNTLGAVLGTIGSCFLLMPSFGVLATGFLCAGGNLLVGAIALLLDRRAAPLVPAALPSEARAGQDLGERRRLAPWERAVLGTAFLSGFAALALEVCWSRLFGTIYGSSLHGFSVTLAGFLMGIGWGSLIYGARLEERPATWFGYGTMELGIALGAAAVFLLVPEIVFWNFQLQPRLRDHPFGWLLIRYGMSSLVLLPPTFLMGMAFPAAVSLFGRRRPAGEAAGAVYGWSTLGSILGSFASGFWLLPWMGLEGTILAATALLAAIGSAMVLLGWREGEKPGAAGAAMPAVCALGLTAVLALRPPWNPALVSVGGIYFRQWQNVPAERGEFFSKLEGPEAIKEVLFYRDGRNASVGVYRGPRKETFLEVNGKVDASTGAGDMPTQILTGLLPMFADRSPRDALVVGCGSGTTLGVLTLFPQLERIDLVELEKAVVEGSRFFHSINHKPFEDPRVRWVENDGRNQLLLEERSYDLIVSEPSNPWMMGAANLFTLEFFRLARERLAPGGLLVQWLQLYSIAPEDLQVLVRTILAEFPDLLVFQLNEVDLVLLAWREGPARIDLRKMIRGFEDPEIRGDLGKCLPGREKVTLADVIGYYRMDGERARRFAGGAGPLNTDDNLWIESRTPFTLFRDTNFENAEGMELYPAPLVPRLIFPDSEDEALLLSLGIARDFQRKGRKRLALEFYQEFLRRLEAESKAQAQLEAMFSKEPYQAAGELAAEFGYGKRNP